MGCCTGVVRSGRVVGVKKIIYCSFGVYVYPVLGIWTYVGVEVLSVRLSMCDVFRMYVSRWDFRIVPA